MINNPFGSPKSLYLDKDLADAKLSKPTGVNTLNVKVKIAEKAESIKIEHNYVLELDSQVECRHILMSYGNDEGNIPKSHRYWKIKP